MPISVTKLNFHLSNALRKKSSTKSYSFHRHHSNNCVESFFPSPFDGLRKLFEHPCTWIEVMDVTEQYKSWTPLPLTHFIFAGKFENSPKNQLRGGFVTLRNIGRPANKYPPKTLIRTRTLHVLYRSAHTKSNWRHCRQFRVALLGAIQTEIEEGRFLFLMVSEIYSVLRWENSLLPGKWHNFLRHLVGD